MCKKSRLFHTKQLFISEDILPFKELITYNSLLFMYDFVNSRLPETFDGTWLTNWQNNPNLNYGLRNANDFKIHRTRYVYLDEHPFFKFPKSWNELDDNLKYLGSRNIFANRIKKDLLSNLNY